jgi:O-antigen/teichoic acid export membrane protein
MPDPVVLSGAPRPRWLGSTGKRNVLANWTAFAFGAAVAFAMTPFVVHSLGDTGYGIWVLLTAMVNYLGLLDLGVRGAVTRYVAGYRAAAQDLEAGRVASAAIAILAGTGVVAIVVSVMMAILFLPLFHIPAEYVGQARTVVVLGGLLFATSLVSGAFGGILAAVERFDVLCGIDILTTTLRAISIYVGLSHGIGLVGLVLIQFGYTLVRGGLNYALARRQYPELRLTRLGWGWPELQRIFSFSLFSAILHVSEAVILETDSLVIAAFLPVHMVALFAIGANLTLYARAVFSGISQTMTPRTSALQSGGRRDELQGITLKAGRIATLVSLPIVVTFLVRGESFINLWMGPDYGVASGQILAILSVALTVQAARQVATSAIIGLNRHRELAPWYLGEAAANLALSLLLVRSMGLAGVALGTVIPSLFVSMLVIPWRMRHVFGTPIRRTWLQFWVRPVVAMIPFMLASYAVEHLSRPHDLYGFFLQVAAILPVAFGGIWLVGLEPEERSSYRSLVWSNRP